MTANPPTTTHPKSPFPSWWGNADDEVQVRIAIEVSGIIHLYGSPHSRSSDDDDERCPDCWSTRPEECWLNPDEHHPVGTFPACCKHSFHDPPPEPEPRKRIERKRIERKRGEPVPEPEKVPA